MLEETPLLLGIKRLIFAERAEHDQAADAGLEQHFDMPRGCVKIDRLIALQLCRDRGEYAGPERFRGAGSGGGGHESLSRWRLSSGVTRLLPATLSTSYTDFCGLGSLIFRRRPRPSLANSRQSRHCR